ncbi:thiamine pyrophosphate-binding protein [Pseudoalteromonas ardens]|uniref:Pyruvate decarboxylase n=1 Tax=Pseudoalteromonas rubra TaxID=43658 RepID=A0A0L0EWP2_9GAMM|nr:thiamine pyrophosphate-binding protein [Pseudoalteromonas sp. R96]KNC68824.1 pyruvate decarboxylase [Pseudoalteromonas rubra]MDK1311927.1 thiamine pyrophosphate-binding protein [Pseudoalteromonas sp. R96]
MSYTVAEFITLRLKQLGCYHVFGVPGTSCSDFIDSLVADPDMQFVNTVNELEAGYAADGYGRQGAIGAVSVAYGVGTLSMANGIASALTERVPLAVINGGPTDKDLRLEAEYDVLFSHSTGFGKTDLKVFRKLTLGAAEIRTLEGAADRIDRLLIMAIERSGPVYIEIPQDLWKQPIGHFSPNLAYSPKRFKRGARPFTQAVADKLAQASNPVVLLGAELVRFGLIDEAMRFVEAQNLPFYTTLLSKSLVSESHPLFCGVYDSDLAPSTVTQGVESSDCVIALGCLFGIDHRYMVTSLGDKLLRVAFNKAMIGTEVLPKLSLGASLESLNQLPELTRTDRQIPTVAGQTYQDRRAQWQSKLGDDPYNGTLGHDGIFAAIGDFLTEQPDPYYISLDTCLASFPGADIPVLDTQCFLSNPIWLSIGQGTPAAIGAYFATGKRPLIVTGDGGFQMVSQAFSSFVQNQIPGIIVIIDNGSYAIEQFLIDGTFFTEPNKAPLDYVMLNGWKYENMPHVYNGGIGLRVTSYDDLLGALHHAHARPDQPCVIAAQIPMKDLPAENRAFLGI